MQQIRYIVPLIALMPLSAVPSGAQEAESDVEDDAVRIEVGTKLGSPVPQ